MDPLSVTMAIVGLLTASQKISSALGNLVSKGKSAPKEIQNVKSTVDTMRSVLLQLQMLLLGRAKVDRKRTSLILVEQIVITLSACVATFSDLDVFVGTLASDAKLGIMDRIRWATKTATIKEHLQKLEMHKSSLTLMMTILTCGSTYEAEDAVDALSRTIQQVLDNHQVLAQRLLSIEIGLNIEQPLTSNLPETSEHVPETIQRNAGGFAFEEVLQNSWVYQRSDRKGDRGAFSAISSAGRTASWSMLSGLSLSDNISIIAVQALPVYAHDLSNAEVYQFGEFNDSSVVLENDKSSAKVALESPDFSRSFRRRLSRIAAGITGKIPRKEPGAVEATLATPNGIFGVPLIGSIQYANVAISLVDATGKSFIYGYVPIVVANIGVFLKERGTELENIFARSGSATRIHELEGVFDSAKHRYGKGLDWITGDFYGRESTTEPTLYDVYDAASCLLRYLKLLPEPVVPFDLYDQFTAALGDELPPDFMDDIPPDDFDGSKVLSRFQQLIISLPSLNRQLLLYLLDLLAVFASQADKNRMTSQRIVAAFQPALLSRPVSEMSASGHILAANAMVFLVENQDHFLIGMRGAGASDSNDKEPAKTPVGVPARIARHTSLNVPEGPDGGGTELN
ncbi:Rho GTPase activation protein [Rhexocercosporidium sp. MPI-PUGE-AT-0058]|nr:Rho GTPase activation protein [Rhexocercosporidium sp. MPI-PUGE-AT-0058]